MEEFLRNYRLPSKDKHHNGDGTTMETTGKPTTQCSCTLDLLCSGAVLAERAVVSQSGLSEGNEASKIYPVQEREHKIS